MRQARYTKGLTVALQEEVYNKIRKITEQEKISMGEWIRNMADKALSNYNYQKRSSSWQNELTS